MSSNKLKKIRSANSGNTTIESRNANVSKPEAIDVTCLSNVADSEFIYYTAQKVNNTNLPIRASYLDLRKGNLLNNNCSFYKMAIVKFAIDLETIPMFLVGDAEYSVTIFVNDPVGAIFYGLTEPLFFGVDPLTPIFTQTQFIYMLNGLNQTLANLYALIAVAYPGVFPYSPIAPYANFDASTGLLRVNANLNFRDFAPLPVVPPPPALPANTGAQLQLFFSPNLMRLFQGLTIIPAVPNIPGDDFRLSFTRAPDNSNLEDFDGTTINEQDYPSSEAWYSLVRILLVSDNIKVRTNYIGSFAGTGVPTDDSANIIADFDVTYNNSLTNNPSSVIKYFPTSEYRYLDLLTASDLTRLDFTFEGYTKYGRRFFIMLRPHDSFNLEVLFTRRLF